MSPRRTLKVRYTPIPSLEGHLFGLQSDTEVLLEQMGESVVILYDY